MKNRTKDENRDTLSLSVIKWMKQFYYIPLTNEAFEESHHSLIYFTTLLCLLDFLFLFFMTVVNATNYCL